jgi:hypothetical protein
MECFVMLWKSIEWGEVPSESAGMLLCSWDWGSMPDARRWGEGSCEYAWSVILGFTGKELLSIEAAGCAGQVVCRVGELGRGKVATA